MPRSAIHVSPYSGLWYPADPAELNHMLAELWRQSQNRIGASLAPYGAAFVVPHAGLRYSGVVAAAVYRYLEQVQPERIILAGFSHRGGPAAVCIPEIEAYSTPLGTIQVDAATAKHLAGKEPFRLAQESTLCDHSIEIQLPLLSKAVPQARILPLYVGHITEEARSRAAAVLAELLTEKTVLLASSDLTHYGADFGFLPFPVDEGTADNLRALDEEVLEAVGTLETDFFLRTLRRTSATVCGIEPISLLLETVRRLDGKREFFSLILDYMQSGEITGEYETSVSYGALGFFPQQAFELEEEAAQAALELARRTLDHYQKTGSRLPPAAPSLHPALKRHCSLFVSIHQKGKLRGCLGRTDATLPLERLIPEMTLAAALDDPRFAPVKAEDQDLEIEISLLTPMKRILDRAALQAGVHGAVLEVRGRRGLLLPQVASERGWDRDRFLQALAMKAGVPLEALDDPEARLYVFRAQVIH